MDAASPLVDAGPSTRADAGSPRAAARTRRPTTRRASEGTAGARAALSAGADRTDDTLSLWAAFENIGVMPRLLVEVRPDDPTRASACIAWTSDAATFACPTTRCADSGTLTVSAVPPPRSGIAAIAARLVARFGDLEITLEVPPP